MFDKPQYLVGLKADSVYETSLYHARQAFNSDGSQNPSLGFSLYWLQLMKQCYTNAAKVHPKSLTKRKLYIQKIYPYGQSIYRNPSRFYRWYLKNNHGLNIGDPTGHYFIPLNSEDIFLAPHPKPNMLADHFTYSMLKYYLQPPKVRLTRPATNYGFIKLFVPPYVSLDKLSEIRWKNKGGTQISGYLDEEIIKEFIRSEVGLYVRQFKTSMNFKYLQYLKEEFCLNE